MPEPKYVAETLAWCNALRKEQGQKPLKKLPKGKKRHPTSCPCGEATNLHVKLHSYYTADSGKYLGALPKSVKRFVAAFDAGLLPQYDEAA